MSTLQDPEVLIQLAALLGMAATCVWVGSKRSQIEDDDVETETITTGDAMKFPLFASGALLSIYLLFRYLDPEYLALFIAAYFVLIGTAGVQFAISPLVTKVLSPLSKNIADKIVISLVDGDKDGVKLLKFSRADIVSGIIGVIASAIYFWTHHWISTNFIAMSVVIGGLQVLKLDSFQVACILLAGLFFYDIFWVFGTDVMVTVSKSVDGPIKILFPSDILTAGIWSKKQGMLGLGDIMIPGVVIAMLYRFDIKRGGGEGAPTPYFHSAFIGYVVGLIITFIALHVSQHPQPALLYLSPMGILVPLTRAWLYGEVKELFEYGEGANEEKEEEETPKED